MEFNYLYQKDSLVDHRATRTDVSFAPDMRRDPTFFRGELRQRIEFREAMSALHDVVISDLKWKPKDRTGYRQWLEQQDEVDWSAVAARQTGLAAQLEKVRTELNAVRDRRARRMQGFNQAREKYFRYLFVRDHNAWLVLDPVITVHPDELFFECFSRDESSYARLGVGFEVFTDVDEFGCGTTNIDYSSLLYDEFQKIRSYKTTRFEVDPGGFEVQTTGDEAYREVKIELPDSWVRGFLQVSSAMSLPAATFRLHPMDVYNICLILRRHREIKGPRSMRFQLTPDRPVRIIFDPWGIELTCPRSIYEGAEKEEIRIWGRRGIHVLERLIPIARSFSVQLPGSGMPSFYTADLGDMTFTLGLSGWTANDWSVAGNFDLLAPRAEVDIVTKQRVFAALSENWYESPDSLSSRLGLDRSVVLGALAAWTQAGRAIWDAHRKVYRVRELTREPLPIEQLRFSNEREQNAAGLLERNAIRITNMCSTTEDIQVLEGTVGDGEQHQTASLTIDSDERLIAGECSCNWHQQNRLRRGPCEHILGLRMQFTRENRPSRLATLFTERPP